MSPRYANLPARNALVLEYLGDGNALDTNDGTKATLVATNVSYASCPVGYSKQVGLATNGRITGSQSAITGNWSIVMDLKRTASAANNGSIVELGTVGSSGFGVMVWGTGGFGVADGAIDWWVNNLHIAASDYTATNVVLPLNTWTHVAIVYDGTNVTTYQDNVQKSQIGFSTNPASYSTCCFYDRYGDAGNYFKGSQRSRVFNKALTETERLAYWHEFNRQLGGGSDFGAYIPAPKYGGINPKNDEYSATLASTTNSPSDVADKFGITTARGYNGSNNSDQDSISIASGSSVTYMVMVNGNNAPANVAPSPSYEYACPVITGTGGSGSCGIQWNYTVGYPDRIGAAFVNTGTNTYASFGTLSGSTWYCLTFRFDQANNTLRTYRDGVFQNQSSTSGTLSLAGYALFGGNGGGLTGFPGNVGQWAIWDSALSDGQILAASQMMMSGRYPYAFRRSLLEPIRQKAKFYAPDVKYNISQSGYDLNASGSPYPVRAQQNTAVATSNTGWYYYNNGSIPSCSLTTTGSYTIACWIRSTDTTGVGYYLYWGDDSAPLNVTILLLSGVIQIDWSRSNVADDLTSTGLTPDGNWHHVAATFSGGVTKVYLDGHLKTTGSYTQSVGTGTNGGPGNGVSVARGFDAQTEVSDPYIADSALTASEIRSLMYSTYRF